MEQSWRCIYFGFALIIVTVTLSRFMCAIHESVRQDVGNGPVRSRTIAGGRASYDGKWFRQLRPFKLFAYSAFYDNRLNAAGDHASSGIPQTSEYRLTDHGASYAPRVVVIVVSQHLQHVTHCCLRYTKAHRELPCSSVEATFIRDYLIICRLPLHNPIDLLDGTLSGREIPTTVSLQWDYFGRTNRTSFEVPVEPVLPSDVSTRQVPFERRGKLAMCVNRLFGDQIEPNRLVEWFELQALLGVEHIVLYNHSLSSRLGRVISGYMETRHSSDNFRLELRQTWPFSNSLGLTLDQRTEMHQGPCLTDCYYRLAGRYQWIASQDIDEVIVPRMPTHSSIPQMIEVATEHGKLRPGELYFQMSFFFHDLNVLHRNKSTLRTGLQNDSAAVDSLSYFATTNLRTRPLKVGFAPKCIHDADACVAVHVHSCVAQTTLFTKPSTVTTCVNCSSSSGGGASEAVNYMDRLAVPQSIGLLHHYRVVCQLNTHPNFERGSCQRLSLFNDNTIAEKYGRTLTSRLAALRRQLD